MRKVRRKVEEELSLDEGALDEYKEFMRILIDQARASKRPLALAHCHLRSHSSAGVFGGCWQQRRKSSVKLKCLSHCAQPVCYCADPAWAVGCTDPSQSTGALGLLRTLSSRARLSEVTSP